MKKDIYALVDCDNFYVSCERLFRPELQNKPVLVLSNNDGCIVSRSNEVKKLGTQMGTPYFKAYDLIKQHNISVFSSNYTLYADISNRIVKTLKKFSPNIEVYSIDEAFLTLKLSHSNYTEYGKDMRERILHDVGIPTTIGIAYSKTLCKVATKIAKKNPQYEGVLSLLDIEGNDKYLEMVEVDDIWGVGRKYSVWLKSIGINSAKQLKYANRNTIRGKMTVQGLRTVLELNNIPCIPLETHTPDKKSITSSKSFGKKTDSLEDIQKALSIDVARAGEKLRSQNTVAGEISIFILTDPFKSEHYSNMIKIKLPYKTSDSCVLIKYAMKGLKSIFKEGYIYKKCGAILTDISPKDDLQLNLFTFSSGNTEKKETIMKTIDMINKKWGRDTIKIGSMGVENTLMMKQTMKSPRYTTDWEELLIARL